MTIIRIFDTAMDPDDIELGKKLFREQVRPAFKAFDGCHGVEMNLGIEEHTGDLVDVASISRWDSMEAIQKATATEDYKEALAEIRKLFQRTPIIRHFELVD
jgi:quinol monooxygenase YgiN